MRLCAEGVLASAIEPCDALAVPVGAQAHGHLVEGTEQAVVAQRVNQGGVAEAVATARIGQQIRGVGHGLLTASHHDVSVTGLDHLIGLIDGVETGQTHLVDHSGRDAHGDPTMHGSLSGRQLPGARQQHLTHDDVVHLLAVDASPAEGRGDGESTQLGSAEPGQRTGHLGNGGAGAGHDDRSRHGFLRRFSTSPSGLAAILRRGLRHMRSQRLRQTKYDPAHAA